MSVIFLLAMIFFHSDEFSIRISNDHNDMIVLYVLTCFMKRKPLFRSNNSSKKSNSFPITSTLLTTKHFLFRLTDARGIFLTMEPQSPFQINLEKNDIGYVLVVERLEKHHTSSQFPE